MFEDVGTGSVQWQGGAPCQGAGSWDAVCTVEPTLAGSCRSTRGSTAPLVCTLGEEARVSWTPGKGTHQAGACGERAQGLR